MGETYKSRYLPENPKKYIGNPNNIICRSSWERRFCNWCDKNENILEWGSEELYIPYYDPVKRKVRKYYPDFFVKVKESTGSIKKYIIGIPIHCDGICPVLSDKTEYHPLSGR